MALMFAAGSVCVLVVLALPHPAYSHGGLIALAASSALGIAGLIWRLAERLDVNGLTFLTAVGMGYITLDVALSGQPASPFAALYLLLSAYAGNFLPWRRAAALICAVGLAYGSFLLVFWSPSSEPVARYLLTMSALVTVTAAIVHLRVLVDRLVHSAEQQALLDGLTGLANRRAFDEAISRESARAVRTEAALSLLVADIDHFKGVNDLHGHPAGDAVLKRVSLVLRAAIRESDVPCRLGGEELAAILPDCGPDQACRVAERLRAEVETVLAAGPVPVTISVGVATTADASEDGDALIARADRALYRAKQDGRNRVVVDDPNRDDRRHAPAAYA